MFLPTIDKLNIKGKNILLRLDLDIPLIDKKVLDNTRLQAAIPTIRYLLDKKCGRIVVIGHKGRPKGKVVEDLSLKPIGRHLENLLETHLGTKAFENLDMYMMENLRFHKEEEMNFEKDEEAKEFAFQLASQADLYVNEAFASSHRKAVSIVALPKIMPHAAGLHLIEEVRVLEKIMESPKEPVIILVGGGKTDKAELIDKLLDHGEVLAGGVLPKKVKPYCREKDGRMCIVAAELIYKGKDISASSARNFSHILKSAGTIVWDGPMGDIDNGFWDATRIVAQTIAQSSAYKIVGGGDTVHALQKLGYLDKMDYVSVGGGAMLEFLSYGDLPGLRALRESHNL